MKPENTIENKAAFFALYWGQEVIASDKHTTQGLKPLPVCGAIMKEIDRYRHCYLLLKPLSSISDEEALSVSEIVHSKHLQTVNNGHKYVGRMLLRSEAYDSNYFSFIKVGETIDFFRSRGYALPWKGLSVDDLVEYGWVKLQEVEK